MRRRHNNELKQLLLDHKHMTIAEASNVIGIEKRSLRKMAYDFGVGFQRTKSEGLTRVNKNPVKYGLPAGVKIASRPLLVDGKVKRIYCMVDAEKFVAVNAQKRTVRDKLKQFLTVPQAA